MGLIGLGSHLHGVEGAGQPTCIRLRELGNLPSWGWGNWVAYLNGVEGLGSLPAWGREDWRAYLHGVERAGQAEESGEGYEAEGDDAGADLELHEVTNIVEDAFALLDGGPGRQGTRY